MPAPQRVVRTEVVSRGSVEALAALLDIAVPQDVLPPMWHQTHLLERPAQRDLGRDGHPVHGIPAPPGPGRKRMFAGGRVDTHRPLVVGREATRTTWVAHTEEKTGRSGALTFVTVRSEYTQDGEVAVAEDADIVYRASGSTVPTTPGSLDDPPFKAAAPFLTLRADERLLFRFSALTYNAHRIHYDVEWARLEGYGGLVVHGPLQALMLGELARRHGVDLVGRRFSYRLVAPMTGTQTFTVAAAPNGLDTGAQARDAHGTVTAVSVLGPLPGRGGHSSVSS